MAKKKEKKGVTGTQKLSLVVTGAVVLLLGVLMGVAIYLWQESAYDIGESEGYEDAATRGTQSQRVNNKDESGKQNMKIQNSNTNQASTKPVRQ